MPHPDDIALLDALPTLRINLAHAPEPLLRKLFEATRLTVTIHNPQADRITVTATLTGDGLPAVAATAHSAPGTTTTDNGTTTDNAEPAQPRDQRQHMPRVVPDAVCAPGGIRTGTALGELTMSAEVRLARGRRSA